jgi:hypothetical protein
LGGDDGEWEETMVSCKVLSFGLALCGALIVGTGSAAADQFSECKKAALRQFLGSVATGGLGIGGITADGKCNQYLDPANNESHREYIKFKWQLQETWRKCGPACF